MDFADFEYARQRLKFEGYLIQSSSFEEAVFGSWLIEFSSEDSGEHRLIWDGKAGWIILQVRSDDDWQDTWIAREGDRQTLDQALGELVQ